jgi:predicted ATPase
MVNVVNDLVSQDVIAKTNGEWELRGEVRDRTLGMPVNLRQLIEQQIARVSPDERKVLEAASVAGAEFSAATVAAGAEQSAEAVETYCDGLVRREQFLRARGTAEWPDGTIAARYSFVHALYQEALYDQISASRRTRLHKQIGEREEQGYGERVREIAAELAVHFERGRDYTRAVQYRQQAGQRASQRGANTEAVSHVTIGLELLKTLPDTPARMQQELTLQLTLGALRTATHGFAAPEVAQAYGRARELCEQTGAREQIFPALVAVAHYHAMRAEHKTARELSERLYAIAQDSQNPDLLIEAHFIQGDTLIWIGEFLEGRAHLEQGIALYDPDKHRAHAFSYGLDPGVLCRLMATQVLWLLGYPDQALTRAQEALELVQDFPHANSVSIAMAAMALIHSYRRDWPSAQKHAEATVAYATEHDLPYLVAQMSIFWGAALASLGHADEGITKMKEGLALQRAIGGRILQQLWLGLQVEAYIDAGRYAEGWAALEEAMTVRPNHGDRYWEAELYRLKGELLLAQARPNSKTPDFQYSPAVKMEVEACYQQAREVARELSAKSLELRAAISLARLWQQQGKREEAHQLLAEIYGWFTEGFDTKDLQEAKELLAELSH